ncbi:hypothetical protein ACFHYQ_08865 [Sphaerimonospora cavernae]|uniref:DUF8175 domain-containing protein n=1 Tax=Sphaerimonospora cavernae TaxID=1740611 RepID=A0ABV6U1R6_9ACTN
MNRPRNRRRLLALGGVMAALVAAVALLTVMRWSSPLDRPSAVPSNPVGQGHAVPSAPAGPAQAVPPASADQATPDMDLRGWRWADYRGVRLPYSSADGPRVVAGDRAYGFAPTPGGAVLAALHLGMRASPRWGPAVFEPTITEQFTGPETPALLRAVRATYDSVRAVAGVADGEPIGLAYVVVEAFRWQAYAPGLAIVDVVMAGPGRGGTTVRAATRMQLLWRDGDWRVVAPPGGDWARTSAVVTDLTGYTLFPASARGQAAR